MYFFAFYSCNPHPPVAARVMEAQARGARELTFQHCFQSLNFLSSEAKPFKLFFSLKCKGGQVFFVNSFKFFFNIHICNKVLACKHDKVHLFSNTTQYNRLSCFARMYTKHGFSILKYISSNKGLWMNVSYWEVQGNTFCFTTRYMQHNMTITNYRVLTRVQVPSNFLQKHRIKTLEHKSVC